MISAINEVETAVQAMKHGAYHYITKDFDYDELRSLVRNACERQDLNRQVITLSARRSPSRASASSSIGPSRQIRDIVDLVAQGRQAVGHGADSRRERHRQGAAGAAAAPRVRADRTRRSSPSTSSAIPHELVESTLFGHERGSFTGAHQQQLGQVRARLRRHAVPRRDRRPAPRPAGQAAARDPGRGDRAGRRHQADPDRRSA